LNAVVGGMFDLLGYLTTRKEKLTLSASNNAAPAVEALVDFLKIRGITQDMYQADVLRWSGKNGESLKQ